MFTVELYAGIRRAVMVDGLSRREAAKRAAPQLTRARAPFFLNQTGTLLICHLAHFVSAIDIVG